ncbi:unnamed protein product [Prunus brigantina]
MVSQRKKVTLLTQREQNIFTKTSQLVFSHANHKNTQTNNKQTNPFAISFLFWQLVSSAALVIFCSF